MANRKLGKPSDQRVALLRNLTTELIRNEKIVTTEARAKEVRSIAEKLITLAVKEYKNTVTVEKETRNEKDQVKTHEVQNDSPSRLHARRQIMSYLYNVPDRQKDDESRSEYKERTAEVENFVVEKLFRELAPKYDKLSEEGKKGGYTRIVRLGQRRGDAAEVVSLELV